MKNVWTENKCQTLQNVLHDLFQASRVTVQDPGGDARGSEEFYEVE